LGRRLIGMGLLAISLVASEARAEEAAEPDPYARAFALRLGVGAGLRVAPEAFALNGTLAALVPLGDLVVLEVIGGVGSAPGESVHDTRLWLDLTAGVRIESRTTPVRAYGSLRVAHLHDAPLHAWGEHTGEALAGDPAHGLGHVTLLGGAAGLVWDVPGTRRHLVLGAELELLGVVHSSLDQGPVLFGDLSAHAAWTFF
jgi:hypothetical protein